MAFFTEVLLPLEGAKIRQGLQLPSQDSTAFSGASALPSASGHNFGFAAVAWQQSSEVSLPSAMRCVILGVYRLGDLDVYAVF